MRLPPRLTPTSLTPALPGFVVSGHAKSAGFETSEVSLRLHPIRAMAQTSDVSVLKTTNRHDREGEAVQQDAPFERVQITTAVERQTRSLGTPARTQSGRSFERVQIEPSIDQPKSRRGRKRAQPSPSPTSFERVQLTAEYAGRARPHNQTPWPFERVQTPPPSGQPPDTPAAAPPFERVQMPSDRTQFPVTPRPSPPYRPPRMTPAQETPLRPTTTEKGGIPHAPDPIKKAP